MIRAGFTRGLFCRLEHRLGLGQCSYSDLCALCRSLRDNHDQDPSRLAHHRLQHSYSDLRTDQNQGEHPRSLSIFSSSESTRSCFQFTSFTECQKPKVDCDKYLESLSLSSQALAPSDYHVKSSSFSLDLFDGLMRYDLTSPFYVPEGVYMMVDQSLGGRISIDTSHPGDAQSDYAFAGNKIAKVSQKNDANWKFTIRALVAPYELVAAPATTTPSKSSANTFSPILLAAMLLVSQL